MLIIPSVKILRVEESYRGTVGVLTVSDMVFCVTLEPKDQLNKRNISNIPAGQYACEKVISPKFGETYQILDVPDRDYVLFHAGNRISDTEGCILVAEKFGKLYGELAILNSGKTFKNFMAGLSEYQRLSLTIREVY